MLKAIIRWKIVLQLNSDPNQFDHLVLVQCASTQQLLVIDNFRAIAAPILFDVLIRKRKCNRP